MSSESEDREVIRAMLAHLEATAQEIRDYLQHKDEVEEGW